MKAVMKTQPGPGAELVERPLRSPGPGEVRVRIEVAAICGSDVHVYEWAPRVAKSGMPLPVVMGHEYAGEVVEVGPGVTQLQVGDRVSGETHFPCGNCHLCRIGKQHICQNLQIVGRHFDGCFAEEMIVPAICAYRVPDSLSFETAALLEPLGCGVRPLLDAEVAGSSVLVLGAGPIGLFAVAGARALGAVEVMATNRSEFRLDLAAAMGATACINPEREDVVEVAKSRTDGVGVDIVLESSGSQVALGQGLKALRKGGTMLLIGLPSSPVEVDVTSDLILKEITVRGFHGREMFRTWERVLPLVANGAIPTEPVITHRMALGEFAEGFAAAAERRAGKVLLSP
jgi:threonine 3-dehydrogenase